MATLLCGELPVSVINNNKYISLLTCNKQATDKCKLDSRLSLEHVIQTALSEAKTVVVVGSEGSGKSTTLEKLVGGWSKGEQLQNFSHVYFFRLSEINLLNVISLEALLQHSRSPPVVPLTQLEDVLFILDELDHYKYSLDPSVYSLCSDPNQAISVSCLVASMLQGSLMSGASFLVASRTTANLKFLNGIQVEVLGFQKPQREAFFKGLFTDPAVANNALQHMETTLGFYDFSSFPRFCWTVCSVYKHLVDSGTELPKTLSQLFVYIMAHLIQKFKLKDNIQKTVLALGELASYSALGQHLTFTRDEIVSLGLKPLLTSEIQLGAFLRVDGDPESDTAVFCWHSQLMQEFILAVSFFLEPTSEGAEKMLEKHKNHAKFLDVFMSGLSEPVHRRPLEALLGLFNPVQILDFKNWFQNVCEKTLQGFDKVEHCHCYHLLYQTQNKNVVKALITPSARTGLSYGNLSHQDYVMLNYVVTQLSEMEQFNLYHTSNLTEEIARILTPALSLSHKIILSQCSFGDGAVSCLASALSRGLTKELDLSNSCLNDAQFKSVCTGLRDSKLHSLKLSNCRLTEGSCKDLVSALTSAASQLCVLQLSSNQIGDLGLIALCIAMQSPHCRVQDLQLQHCCLTASSMEDLSTALSSGHSELRRVTLSNNEVGDIGVQALCKCLKDPLCKLQSLRLFDCELTGACCPHLMEALMSKHCSLLELELSVNDLGHEGALLLCRALKRPGCPMENLGLVRCQLTEVVFIELASLLKSGTPPLKSLSVGINKVGDQGVKHLWNAMTHQSCQLEKLDVEMTGLTDACVEDMCSAIRACKTLKKLVLPNNSLTDVSVPALIKVMQDSPNMLEMNLKYNDFSDDMFDVFSECEKIRY